MKLYANYEMHMETDKSIIIMSLMEGKCGI